MMISAYTKGRDNNFNLIRLVAAYAVLLSHSFTLASGTDASEPLMALGLGVTLGRIAVDVFFVTSGFLVFSSLKRTDNLLDFGSARVLRIFPGLVVMLAFVVLVIGPLLTKSSLREYFFNPETLQYFVINATLLPAFVYSGHDWLPGLFNDHPFAKSVNGSLWTLPTELAMYSILGGMWILSRRSRTRRAWLLSGVSVAAALGFFAIALFVRFKSGKWYGQQAEMGYMFFCGAALFVFRDHISLSTKTSVSLILALILAGFIGKETFFIVLLLTVPYILIFLAYVPTGSIRSINRFGDYSYGIYIYAFPIQQSIMALFPGTSVKLLFFTSAMTTLLFAMGSWHLVENKALAFKKRIWQPGKYRSFEVIQKRILGLVSQWRTR